MEKTTRRLPWGLIGLTLGATAVGVCVGLLYAPKKGEETREDVKDWLKNKREQSRHFFAKSKDVLVEKRNAITTAIRNRREAVNGAKKEELVAA